ncbi:MAG: hypothetical protein CMO80_15735 [Verrucomicrobiales bacterium]|nr:hypothetical protein [Verrucomicrobiales bacterium]
MITAELRQDLGSPLLREVVEDNLRSGKTYRYFVPESADLAAHNVATLKSEFGEWSPQISITTLPSDTSVFFFGEIVLYDPLNAETMGFTYLHGDERGLLVQLPLAFIEAHVELERRLATFD